ncbi:hypothetical protein ACIQF6_24885 [Kitasatospora sp. NPDC092948]|uniref:hypothetical protein n=1 Tax=Kitasatospora sp. NPDC092948 TaxID=3364088 RepID=UPI00382E1F0C
MRTRTTGRPATLTARTAAGALAALLLLGTATVTVTATVAAADPGPTPSATATGATATGATATGGAADSQSRADLLAAELRKNPVYVSAARPRELPRSLAPQIAALAKRTGVPTYVLAVPEPKAAQLLAVVHDRLGENGLYVVIDGYGDVIASAFGIDVPAEDAERIARYSTSYDAAPLARFEAFVDAVTLSKEQAGAKSDELAARYRNVERSDQYISATDRQNQNLVLGIVSVLIPGLLIALGLRFSRRYDTPYEEAPSAAGKPAREGRGGDGGKVDLGKPTAAKTTKTTRNAKGAKGAKTAAAVRAARHRGVLTATLLAAVLAVAGVVLAAPKVYPQTVDGPDLAVSQADLDARVDEIAAGLAAGPIYQDPSTPYALTAAELPALRQRIAELAPVGPVHVVVTASTSEDETNHDSRLLLSLIRQRTGQNGVYILIDPSLGRIDLSSYGTDRDVERRFARLDFNIRYPYGSYDDPKVMPRLGQVLDAVAAAEPRPGDDPVPTEVTLPPLRGNRLPALFTGDFRGGLALGALLLGLVLLAVRIVAAAVRAVLRRRRARSADPSPAHPAAHAARPRRGTAQPSLRQLRGWAEDDVRALAAALAAAAPDAPGRARAWDCLDAAELLADAPHGADEPAGLAAVVVLAQGGLAALHGDLPPTVCRLNPLHGAATGGRVPTWFARIGIGPQSAQLCPDCRDALRAAGANRRDADPAARLRLVADRQLRLPAPDGHAVWDEAGSVLSAAREGLDPLVLRARESVSVQ